MDRYLSYLLDLRLKVRRNREATDLVDQCLSLVARARTADAATLSELEQEVNAIADTLALRFGAPADTVIQ